MSTPDASAAFFDAMFKTSVDPWNFAADGYEQARYNTLIHALGARRYRFAFEPGCSVGALTEKLAAICDCVDASDFSPSAVAQARLRCRLLPGVTVRCAALTDTDTFGKYDLIVLSEIGYYFSAVTWQCLVDSITDTMQPGAVLLASHWLGSSPDHEMSGDEVHSLMHHQKLHHDHTERHPDTRHGGFRLDRWRKQS